MGRKLLFTHFLKQAGIVIGLLCSIPSAWSSHDTELGYPGWDTSGVPHEVSVVHFWNLGFGVPGRPINEQSGQTTSMEEAVTIIRQLAAEAAPHYGQTVTGYRLVTEPCGAPCPFTRFPACSSQYPLSLKIRTPLGTCADSAFRRIIYVWNDTMSNNGAPSVLQGTVIKYVFESARQTSYTVKLSPVSGTAETTITLASVEPARSTELLARVYDQNNQLVHNVGVELKLEAVNQSGGHQHGDNTAVERTGTLASNTSGTAVSDSGKTLTGSTGTNGLQFDYNAPAVSGDININAKCTGGKNCNHEGSKQVWVGVKGLEPIIPASDPATGSLYVLIGQDGHHPSNHYLKPNALGRLQQLAALYRQRFPNDPPLHLNDGSLERGGLFDIYWENAQKGTKRTAWWTPPHAEHRRGTVIDVRANRAVGAIPNTPRVRGWFEQQIRRLNGSFLLESLGTSNEHYHVRLMGVAE